ncbi:hypothetical protein AAFF_G00304630 [Aldrovandia affinis]|uniref:Uncharacterized protein n=1 Tax=Aldrovandia affinis TaxID=143900 RepID=A0AAD7SP17_9TELE|nr:hypothetical protein AAFF_G00304630 [Aldrovandia affinis]
MPVPRPHTAGTRFLSGSWNVLPRMHAVARPRSSLTLNKVNWMPEGRRGPFCNIAVALSVVCFSQLMRSDKKESNGEALAEEAIPALIAHAPEVARAFSSVQPTSLLKRAEA